MIVKVLMTTVLNIYGVLHTLAMTKDLQLFGDHINCSLCLENGHNKCFWIVYHISISLRDKKSKIVWFPQSIAMKDETLSRLNKINCVVFKELILGLFCGAKKSEDWVKKWRREESDLEI